MTGAPPTSTPDAFARDLEEAHRDAVAAAAAGLRDAALGPSRLRGAVVPALADAAVTSATPYLRAPLLARMSGALVLHPLRGTDTATCPTCRVMAPCPTALVLHS